MTTTSSILILLGAIAVLVAAGLLWDWRRSGRLGCRPLPPPYRHRASQETVWRQRYGGDLPTEAEVVFSVLCDAFMFNPDDRVQLAPDDRLADIYRACYPRWKFWEPGDSMEIESLITEFEKRYGVDDLECRPGTTVGDLVQLALTKRDAEDSGGL